METIYRQLTTIEIEKLEKQECSSSNWENVLVCSNFSTNNIINVQFSGNCKLGLQNKELVFEGDVPKQCGIYHVHLHNCTIGNNVYINEIKNYIANYKIEEGAIIDNCNMLVVNEDSTFGNGLYVSVMDETGGREIIIFDRLSAHLAYLMAFYKHRRGMLNTIKAYIDEYCNSIRSSQGVIGSNASLINCGDFRNVRIGNNATIRGSLLLENGTVHSNDVAPTFVGSGVSLRGFILQTGSSITNGTLVKNCFIGQGCELGSQYSAENSLFFANCQGFHGEACSIFAGPYTVTHHKSTLLIAGMYSFLNAGSGSNQSNHMYKLGPIHHGIAERGSKTTSDSYILWPARIGAFTLIMGRHTKHSDTSALPFSYLIENNNESWLVPGVNLKSVGTIRDALKWPKRDKRTDCNKLDRINFNLLSPYTIHQMKAGIDTLKTIVDLSGKGSNVYSYKNTNIRSSSLQKGIGYYNLAIIKFLGNSIITRLNLIDLKSKEDIKTAFTPTSAIGSGRWLDISGLIAPQSEVEKLLNLIETKELTNLNEINQYFVNTHKNYYEYEWTWTVDFFEEYTGRSIFSYSVAELISFVKEWKNAVITLDNLLLDDAKKEFTNEVMTGFGIDGDQLIQQKDFEHVRGNFEDNSFAKEIIEHIERKTKLAKRVILELKAINQ